MNLRAQFGFSIGLLGLLCFMLPGTLRADDFTFSFTNTIGNVAGTVTGEILGLTNNTIGPATAVILESYPAALSVNPNLAAPPITVTTIHTGTTIPWFVSRNQFTESLLGEVTTFNFDTSVGSPYAALQMYSYKNPSNTAEIYGAALTVCSDAVVFIRPILPPTNTQPPANQNCLFVQTEDTTRAKVITFAPIVSAVPEPGTFSLMLIGIGLVLVMRKRISAGLRPAS